MTDAERAARCAWLVFLTERLDGPVDVETIEATAHTLRELPEAARREHLSWRREVFMALEKTLQRFCPGGDDSCCDPEFWPKDSHR